MIDERIKNLRTEQHLTQKKLGKLLNIQPSTISGYERGRITPSPQIIKQLSDFFNVSVDYLVGKTDIKSKDYHVDQENNRVIILPDDFDSEITNKLVELIEIISSKQKGKWSL